MINNYIKMISGMLRIPMPTVFYNDSALKPGQQARLTPGQQARLTPDGKQLYLRKMKNPSFDLLFSVCFELRQEWQRRVNNELYFGDFKSGPGVSLHDYSIQPSVVDCNAFAAVMIKSFFGVEPQFNGLPGAARTRIDNRIAEIRKNEFPQLVNMKLPHR